jgi:signal peptidase
MSTLDVTRAGVLNPAAHPVDRPWGRPTGRSVLRWCGQVVAVAVILGVTAAVSVAVLVPRIGGATPYTVLTSSMTPRMPPGTLVVVKPRPVDHIGIGDVITYQLESGKPAVVTHRVVAIGANAKGELSFTTRGDANDADDAKPVLPAQVRGVHWYHVPYLGYLNTLVTAKERQTALFAVVALLLGYAAHMFAGEARERRARRRSPV